MKNSLFHSTFLSIYKKAEVPARRPRVPVASVEEQAFFDHRSDTKVMTQADSTTPGITTVPPIFYIHYRR